MIRPMNRMCMCLKFVYEIFFRKLDILEHFGGLNP